MVPNLEGRVHSAPPSWLDRGMRRRRRSLPPVNHSRPYGLVCAGSALGALARAGIDGLAPVTVPDFPWATLGINVGGALLMGFLSWAVLHLAGTPDWARPFLGIGILGGFTTYSAFAVESVQMLDAGRLVEAATYVVVSFVGGIAAVRLGHVLMARWFVASRGPEVAA